MIIQFTTQDIIDMGASLFDKGFTREQIHTCLVTWRDNGMWDATYAKLERVFDLIVG